MDGIPFKDAGPRRKLEDMHANELRLKLDNAGISYPDAATRKDLIDLVREHHL